MSVKKSTDKSEAKLSSNDAVIFPLKSTSTTKSAIRDNSTKGTIVQESKKTTAKKWMQKRIM